MERKKDGWQWGREINAGGDGRENKCGEWARGEGEKVGNQWVWTERSGITSEQEKGGSDRLHRGGSDLVSRIIFFSTANNLFGVGLRVAVLCFRVGAGCWLG